MQEHQKFSFKFPARSWRAVKRKIATLRREFVDKQAKLKGTPGTAGLSLSEAVIQPWTNEEIDKMFDNYNEPRIPPSSPIPLALPPPSSSRGFPGFALNKEMRVTRRGQLPD